MNVEVWLIRCAKHEEFSQELGTTLQKGFKVLSSGMVTELNSEEKGSNGEYYTRQWSQDVWWAICVKAGQ